MPHISLEPGILCVGQFVHSLSSVGSEVGVMMAAVVMMAMNNYHNLRLRRIRYCEAEDEYQS